jgi:hypothetical protein
MASFYFFRLHKPRCRGKIIHFIGHAVKAALVAIVGK